MEAAQKRVRARREIVLISLMTALCLAGDSFLYIALPLHWEAAGLDTLFEVGVILAANRIVRIPLNPLVARFYRRATCRQGFFLAVFFSVVSTAGYGLVQGLAAWLVMRFLWGLAWTLLRLGTLFTIVRVADPGMLGVLTGINNGLYRLGSLAGMLLGGLLADSLGLAAAALMMAALAVPAFALLLMSPGVGRGEAGGRESADTAHGALPSRLSHGCLVRVMMTAFVVAMACQGVTASTISLLVDTHMHEGLFILGATLNAATLSGVLQSLRWIWEPVLAPIFGRMSDSAGRARVTALGCAFCALTMAGAAWCTSLMPLCVMILLVLLAATMVTTASDALGNMAAMHSAGPRGCLAAFALFTDLGAAAGPLLAYAVTALADASRAWTGTGIVLAALAACWWAAGEPVDGHR